MLVLTRKLGANIRKVHREEIYARIQEENRKAGGTRPAAAAEQGKKP